MQHTQKIHHQTSLGTPARSFDHSDVFESLRYQKNEIGILLLRLTVGGLMLIHGITKLTTGTESVDRILEGVGLPVFFSFGVLLAEVLAPVMLILGFKTRIAAFLIVVDMFMAVLLVHSADLLKVTEGGGWMMELNAFYFLGALALMFFGSGKLSVTKGKGYLD